MTKQGKDSQGKPFTLPDDFVDFPPSGLRGVLRAVGAPDMYGNPPPPVTGRIVVQSVADAQRTGYVYFWHTKVYAVHYNGFTPPLARRLVTAGILTPETFATYAKMPPELVGTKIVEHGLAPVDEVETLNRQMMLSSLTHLYEWSGLRWKWEPQVTTTAFTIAPLEPGLVVSATEERKGQWDALYRNYPQVCTGDEVPFPGRGWGERATDATAEELNIYRFVNGENTVSYIAAMCGLTRFELAGRLAKGVAYEIVAFKGEANSEDDSSDLIHEYLLAHKRLLEAEQAVEAATHELRLAADVLEARRIPLPSAQHYKV